ncbi:MAG: HEAT repeat domain-containing protein, partial [Phycisphaerales bacterium]
AMTIGKAQVKDLAERARALLDDPSVFARMAAIFALAANKRQVDPTSLADILLTDPSINARSQAAFILGELRNPSSQPLLRQAMRQTPSSATPEQAKVFQLQVAEALIKLGDDDQRTGVRAALYPSRPEELEAAALAAQILGQVADRKSIDGLVYLSEYKDQNGNPNPAEVRLAVAASLMSMGLKGGEAITDQYANAKEPAIRAQAAYGYGVMGGNHGLNHLATLLADPEPLVRVAAADGILRALER